MAPLPPEEHLAKVPRFLHGAVGAFRDRAWETAIHAVYYACLHAALGLLAERGIAPGTHAGAVTMLGLHFVKPGLLAPQVARELTLLSGYRHLADYGVVSGTDRDAAAEAGRRAVAFLHAVLGLLPDAPPELAGQVGRLRATLDGVPG